jgi:hypothetical protein
LALEKACSISIEVNSLRCRRYEILQHGRRVQLQTPFSKLKRQFFLVELRTLRKVGFLPKVVNAEEFSRPQLLSNNSWSVNFQEAFSRKDKLRMAARAVCWILKCSKIGFPWLNPVGLASRRASMLAGVLPVMSIGNCSVAAC